MTVSDDQLHIETFCLGLWETNCYVVRVGASCWIVDAGFEPDAMIGYIEQHNLEPERVVLTHAHVDHIAGLAQVRARWPQIPIVIHIAEAPALLDPALNLSIALDEPVVAPAATGMLEHGQVLELEGVGFEVRHTPGHSPGGVSLYQHEAGVGLAGDALFAGSSGRTDFPGCDHEALLISIRTQLYTLPDETRVLSGHGPETTIGAERRSNPFVQG